MSTARGHRSTSARGPRADVARARPAGFVHDVLAIAGRALRAVPRDLEAVIPPVFIALFFFIVNIGTLKNLTQSNIAGFDYTAFEMPTAILLGVTGVSRAPALVLDVQNGYFDRLLLTPVRRLRDPARPHGGRRRRVGGADACRSSALGVRARRATSRPARSASSCSSRIAALWSLAFAGFGYAIALKTGNPAAVNSSFLLFFPFLFLTSSYVPRDQLTRLARHGGGVEPGHLPARGPALAGPAAAGTGTTSARRAVALLVVFLVSFSLCFAALRSRVNQR